jgi:hypothetical protein
MVALLQDAVKALFGDHFAVLPVFAAAAENLDQALTQNGILPANDAEPRISLWLQQAAEVHVPIRRLEDVMLVTDAWQAIADAPSLKLGVAQLPFCASRPWQALSNQEIQNIRSGLPDEVVAAGCQEPPIGRPKGVLSIVMAAAPHATDDLTQLAGFMIDEWTEQIPYGRVTTGVSFQFDAPSSQPPQTLLLAVPGQISQEEWTEAKLRDIVKDTLDLCKVRMVDPDALLQMGSILPAAFLPLDPNQPGWKHTVFDQLKARIQGLKSTPSHGPSL